MSKKLAIRRAFQSSDEKENTPRFPTPSLKEYSDNMGRRGGTAAGLDVLVDKIAGAAPSVFAPVLPTLPTEPSTTVSPTPGYQGVGVQTFDAESLRGESVDGTNGRPGLGNTGSRKSRWIKHTLPSGLVIEVEATASNGLSPSPIETTNQPPFHSPIQDIVSTPSPEPSQSGSDYYYTHLEDWLTDPRQGSDIFFEQYMEDLRAQQKLPFHQRPIWQRTFIPTLLKFLGTRSNPWEFSGDAFLTILPDVWLTVYHEPSWPKEEDALVRSLGLFSSTFVLAPLSGHLQAIRGGMQMAGEACSSEEFEYPFGAIGLAAAAALLAMRLFRAQLVRYNEDGNIIVETPTGDTMEPCIMTTPFNKYTAEGRTQQHSSLARKLPDYQLDSILSQARMFALNNDEINSDDQ
uniref:Uncharacterized protein n=1 Tax=Ganoderma boninense TaxID=34458 RepID=A0A5K1K258_9APHY|nr:Uncharacterized protein [Ganoderma boninense]